MKREAILKIVLVLIVGILLFARPVNVVAVSSQPADINDILGIGSGWEDQSGTIKDTETNKDTNTSTETNQDTSTNTNTSTSTSTNTNTSTSTNKNTNTTTSTNNKTDLPKAGLVEDTMMIVAIVALMSVAVFTFVKISDYSNI